jgi:hypothetical protein
MTSFDEAMEKTVAEAKHSISNYFDHKIHSTGLEALRDGFKAEIAPTDTRNTNK